MVTLPSRVRTIVPIMRNRNRQILREIYDRLFRAYGPQRWWPADTPTEVVIGAILTQNTAWKNTERAIDNLRSANVLDWSALRGLTTTKLARLIQPSGTYRVKAARLKALVNDLWLHHNGSLSSMLDGDLGIARKRLLSIPGIGPETADAILLYAGDRPSFVVDAYTRRVLRRHSLIGADARYEMIRALFHDALPADAQLFNEYHALLVEVGKRHCRARSRCESCPLVDLPHDADL